MSYDEYEHALDRTARFQVSRRQRPTGPVDRAVGVALLGVQAALACVAHVAVVLGFMAFDGCASTGKTCDERLGDVLVIACPAAVVLVCVLSVVWLVVRWRRRRRVWWVPVAGTAALVAVVALSWTLISAATS